MDKKTKAPAVPDDAPPHVAAARQAGLRYHGTATSIKPPGASRLVPARHLTPDETAYYVTDRPTLLYLLANGFSLAEPPPEQETDHAD